MSKHIIMTSKPKNAVVRVTKPKEHILNASNKIYMSCPIATQNSYGMVRPGDGLLIKDGVLSVTSLNGAGSLVFDTEQHFFEWLTGDYARLDELVPTDLVVGSTIRIEEMNVPDYWYAVRTDNITIDNFKIVESNQNYVKTNEPTELTSDQQKIVRDSIGAVSNADIADLTTTVETNVKDIDLLKTNKADRNDLTPLNNAIDKLKLDKADKSQLTPLKQAIDANTESISKKASTKELEDLKTVVGGKAAQSDLDTLEARVDKVSGELSDKIGTESFNNLTTKVNDNTKAIESKATQESVNTLTQEVQALSTGLDGKVNTDGSNLTDVTAVQLTQQLAYEHTNVTRDTAIGFAEEERKKSNGNIPNPIVHQLALNEVSTKVDQLDSNKLDSSDIASVLSGFSYDAVNGTLKFELYGGGESQTIDLPVERVLDSGSYDSTTKELVLVFVNGDELRIPVGDLITEYTADGVTLELNGTVFSVKSIPDSKIEGVAASKINGDVAKATLAETAINDESGRNISTTYRTVDSSYSRNEIDETLVNYAPTTAINELNGAISTLDGKVTSVENSLSSKYDDTNLPSKIKEYNNADNTVKFSSTDGEPTQPESFACWLSSGTDKTLTHVSIETLKGILNLVALETSVNNNTNAINTNANEISKVSQTVTTLNDDVSNINIDITNLKTSKADDNDVVKLSQQTLTEAQKTQVKSNLDISASGTVVTKDGEALSSWESNVKLDKVKQQSKVYGTDTFGYQTTIQYNVDPFGDGLVKRTREGRIKATDPSEAADVVTKQYYDNNLPDITGKQDNLTTLNAGDNITITKVNGVTKINSTASGGSKVTFRRWS